MQTAPPGQLVLMLYDGILRFLEQSLTGFSKEDPAEHNSTISNNVVRAQDIIRELARSLNVSQGGTLALELERLYDYFDRRLTESNVHKQPDGIQEVIGRVSILRTAWASMLRGEGPGGQNSVGEPALATLQVADA